MVINCPKCTDVLVKGFNELDQVGLPLTFSFTVKCPTCKHISVLELHTVVRAGPPVFRDTNGNIIDAGAARAHRKIEEDGEGIHLLG